ncbi:proteinase-activated receptor 1 [Aplysia californica]|uniref:Proteinase-activated receptor 1 n=1 Tax=Aplysia californica TaxID=6500 RepID=A0ABM1A7B5_APLCA|nr:proteinase-activated receptor 1 [Aplysia californica]
MLSLELKLNRSQVSDELLARYADEETVDDSRFEDESQLKPEMVPGNISLPASSEIAETGIVSGQLLNISSTVLYILVGFISFFGIVFNAINIIIFFKQGFKDTVNISLLVLAVSDMLSSLALLWLSVCYNPWYAKADLPFDLQSVAYLTGGWPHLCLARISGWITAFVTFERCLCIALPLKVKAIITPRRTIYALVGIYFSMVATVAPVFYSIRLEPKYLPMINETKIVMVYVANGIVIENVFTSVNIFSQFASFSAVIVCTAILVQNLLRNSKWRQSTSSCVKQESVSNRDKKVINMIIFISCIFIICYLPSIVNLIVMIAYPAYDIGGRYHNLCVLIWAFLKPLEGVNSSVNIFVYFSMSSKYREILDRMLKRND